MKRATLVFIIILCWCVAALIVLHAQDKALYMSETRNTPPVVLVRAAVPETAQVCAEPVGGGIVACRPVSEFRKWVREQPTKK